MCPRFPQQKQTPHSAVACRRRKSCARSPFLSSSVSRPCPPFVDDDDTPFSVRATRPGSVRRWNHSLGGSSHCHVRFWVRCHWLQAPASASVHVSCCAVPIWPVCRFDLPSISSGSDSSPLDSFQPTDQLLNFFECYHHPQSHF